MEIFGGLVIVLCVILIIQKLIVKEEKKRNEEMKKKKMKHIQEHKKFDEKYKSIFSQICIPTNFEKVKIFEIYFSENRLDTRKFSFYLWFENETINYFPENFTGWSKNDFNRIVIHNKIDFHSIEYYFLDGEIHYENRITGGGGGGSSYGGAVAGTIVAGGAGAVIGSRKKIEPIKSKQMKHDNRKVVLKYRDANTSLNTIYFEHEVYDILIKNIPQKDRKYIREIYKGTKQEFVSDNNDKIISQIKKLASLHQSGILNEEEFSVKKSMLLEKMKWFRTSFDEDANKGFVGARTVKRSRRVALQIESWSKKVINWNTDITWFAYAGKFWILKGD